jgi:glutamate-ammonia-ligase adenylyltransferase
VLKLLADKGLLPADDVRALTAAYRFLRLTENRIQAWQDRQTHVLPEKPDARERLARSMGFLDWDGLRRELSAHRARVQRCFEGIFAEPGGAEHPLGVLWSGTPAGRRGRGAARPHGFRDPAVASPPGALPRRATRRGLSTRAASTWTWSCRRCSQRWPSEDPDLALPRVLTVLESVLGRTAYLALLSEHPDALRQLVRLSGKSPWFAERTAKHPLLLDELLDPRRLFEPLRRAELERELDVLLAGVGDDDLEQRMERLRQFAQGNMLRTAAADITGVIPLMVVSDYLTEIAEVATARSLDIAYRDLIEPPWPPAGHRAGGARLPGARLRQARRHRTWLQLRPGPGVPLRRGAGRRLPPRSRRPALGERRPVLRAPGAAADPHHDHADLFRRALRDRRPAAPRRRQGHDRPHAGKSFADYQRDEAWTWEHQALVRARPVAGDPRLAERFQPASADPAPAAGPRRAAHRGAGHAREDARQPGQVPPATPGRFDLKQGRGGIADIEFIVQYSVLRWAAEHPELTVWTDNVRLLETLDRLRCCRARAAADLTDAYKALRAAYHRNALQETPGVVPDTADRRARCGLGAMADGGHGGLRSDPVARRSRARSTRPQRGPARSRPSAAGPGRLDDHSRRGARPAQVCRRRGSAFLRSNHSMTMADRDGLIWHDGETGGLARGQDPRADPHPALRHGRVRGRARLQDRSRPGHLPAGGPHRRLFNSAHILGMRVPYDRDTLNEAQRAAVRENGLESAYIRPMFYYGAEGMGLRADNLNVHCIVAAWDWGATWARRT